MDTYLNLDAEGIGYQRNGGRNEIIDSISQRINCGSSLIIVGASGSGKTTLLNMIAGDERIKSKKQNSALISPTETSTLSQLRLQGRIAFIGIDDPFQPWLKIKEGIKSLSDISQSPSQSGNSYTILEMMEKLSLDESLMNKYPHEISYGQRRRFSIILGLLQFPQLLLVDEVFLGLDADNCANVSRFIQSEILNRNLVCILSTHRPDLVAAWEGVRIFLKGDNARES